MKTIVIIIIGIIVISAVGYFGWQYIKSTKTSPIDGWKTYLGFQTPAPTAPTPPATPTPPVTEEIVWQTYSNTKYSYSFKYPSKWYIDTTNAEKDFNASKEGGFLIISNMQNPVKLLASANVPLDLKSLTFTVYLVNSGTTIDQFLKDQKLSTQTSQIDIKMNGLSAKQLIYAYDRKDVSKQILDITTLVKKDVKMFIFHYYTFAKEINKIPQDVETINNEIIKSFEVK